ncbi:MAG: hypothetical protein IT285_11770, partial [Bdellovibrionales bacterium]|nr:hypothetical protein [Bdellovibrionales bacterium]
MQHKTRTELYRDFIQFVQRDTQRERTAFKQRMIQVLVWCFVLPAVASALVAIFQKAGVFPMRYQRYGDWMILLFPVTYAGYFLVFKGFSDKPALLAKGAGGFAGNLGQALRQSEWRDRIAAELGRVVPARLEDWPWIAANFRMDLSALKDRTKFLTALAGAVFFLIFQGIDLLGPEPARMVDQSPAVIFT